LQWNTNEIIFLLLSKPFEYFGLYFIDKKFFNILKNFIYNLIKWPRLLIIKFLSNCQILTSIKKSDMHTCKISSFILFNRNLNSFVVIEKKKRCAFLYSSFLYQKIFILIFSVLIIFFHITLIPLYVIYDILSIFINILFE